MERSYDMIVVGGGPGGYTAALYAARAGLSVAVLEKLSAGGQMALTHAIDNYPGFPEGIDGFELGLRMQQQAERFGAVTEYAEVFGMELNAQPKVLRTSEGDFSAKTVVLAMGAGPRKLGIPGEERPGVHYCAACDGMFYRNRTVAIIGGGNSAAAEAMVLSRIARKVIVIHRRDTLRATKIYHQPLMQAENIEFRWNSAAVELLGEKRVEGLKIKNLLSGQEEEISVDGVFVSIGRSPATELVQGQLALENGYILADESTASSIPGVYAVGDIRTKRLRQVITAAADGAMAAHSAEEYLLELE